MRIVSSNQAIEIYRQFRTKSIYPRCKLRTSIEITSELKIDSMVYSKTTEQKLPPLKKYSTALNFNKEEKAAEVVIERKHYIHDDPNLTDVDAEFKIKGYYYGKQLVPIAKVLEDSLKYKCSKCLKVLGFVDKEKLPRNFYLGQVDMVVPPETDTRNQQMFFSLLMAMNQLSKVAFLRYVTRDNSAPKLSALIPCK
jgi:ATP-dependent DNA helicase 2 subunit 2